MEVKNNCAIGALTPIEIERLAESVACLVAAKMLTQPRLVSRERIAAITSTSVPTIDRLTRAGTIPCVRRGARVLYDPAEVVDAMKNGGDAK